MQDPASQSLSATDGTPSEGQQQPEAENSGQPVAAKRPRGLWFVSLSLKNLAVFLLVFLVALAPLVYSYWTDATEHRIDVLSGQLELIGQRSIGNIRVEEIKPLVLKALTRTELHRTVIARLHNIETEYGVDNAILMRRGEDGQFTMIADGNGQFQIEQQVGIHDRFPETKRAADEAWDSERPMRTGLFGFGTFEYLQVYYPVMDEGRVVALLLINKFAEDVDQAIRTKTTALLVFTGSLALLGVAVFWFFSRRMLAPLVRLKDAAARLAGGDLEVEVPPMSRRDEVSDLSESFRHMVEELRRNREELDNYNAQLERTLARVRLMEDIEKSLTKFVPREVANALQKDPEALDRGKTPMDVSVLFLDVEGSTVFAESLGAKSADRMIEVYFSRFLDCIYDNQGDINETAGDGLMLIFQGDDNRQHALNAVNTSVGIQRITKEIQAGLHSVEGQVRINIGICSGEALVGFTKYEAISGERLTFTASGLTTITAARLADLAKDGTVLISGETMQRLEHPLVGELQGVAFESLGQIELKNVQRRTDVFRLNLG